jgi:hypothetical protein
LLVGQVLAQLPPQHGSLHAGQRDPQLRPRSIVDLAPRVPRVVGIN